LGNVTMTAITEVQSTPVDRTLADSVAEIALRIPTRRLTWAGPLLLVSARTALLVLFQAFAAVVLALRHHPYAWTAAGKWWTVYGTLVDLGCITLMWRFTRREGIGFRDLIGRFRLRRGRDLFVGLGWFAVIFPILGICLPLTARLIYGSWFPSVDQGVVVGPLPFWAALYTLSVWWIIWSPTEETTYQAYVLPRVEALTKRPVVAALMVAFWWALQHCALPLVLDWRYPIWRVLATFPGVLVFVLIYQRTRRLPPLIIAHWPSDIFVAIMSVAPAVFGY
jgi:hypothetical protein